MGVDISSKLMIGIELGYCNVSPEVGAKYEDSHEFLEEEELDYASPWYDSDISDWFVGYEFPSCSFPEALELLGGDIWKAKVNHLEILLGCEVKLKSVPDVT